VIVGVLGEQQKGSDDAMSKQHPQSGPSLSKPTYRTKSRREQEAEDAEAKLVEVEKAEEKANKKADKEAFSKQAEVTGGRIPLRGSDSKEFWDGVHKKQKEARLSEAEKVRADKEALTKLVKNWNSRIKKG
jgi:hypothetical protein